MHEELRLSIALKMVSAKGIAALAEYSGPINGYTRFMCYFYPIYQDYLLKDAWQQRNTNNLQMLHDVATHVIVEVNWGIDAYVVLQLPHNDQLAAAIDRTLKNICHGC
jgi:hypothetical protein